MLVLHASVTGQGRGRPRVAAPYSAFSWHASRHHGPRCEGELLKGKGQGADIIILHNRLSPDHIPRGRRPEHLAGRGELLVRTLRDEIHRVNIFIQLEGGAVVEDNIF